MLKRSDIVLMAFGIVLVSSVIIAVNLEEFAEQDPVPPRTESADAPASSDRAPSDPDSPGPASPGQAPSDTVPVAGAGGGREVAGAGQAGPSPVTPSPDAPVTSDTTAGDTTAGDTTAGDTTAGDTTAGGNPIDKDELSIDIVRVEPSGEVLVAGQADAGAIVVIVEDGKVRGKGIANEIGEFVITLDTPLETGAHALDVRALPEGEADAATGALAARQTVTGADASIVVVLQDSEADSPALILLDEDDGVSQVLQKPAANEAGKAATIASAGIAGEGDVVLRNVFGTPELPAPSPPVSQGAAVAGLDTVTNTGTAGAAPPVPDGSDSLPEGDAPAIEAMESEDDRIYIAGSGKPRSRLQIYVENELVGQVTSDSSGRWLLEGEKALPAETVEVRVDQLEPETGDVAGRASVKFRQEDDNLVLRPVLADATGSGVAGASADTVRTLPKIIIRRGDNLWTISRRRYGEGIRYTTIYLANKRQIRDPDLIYPGQVFVMPQGDVNWEDQ